MIIALSDYFLPRTCFGKIRFIKGPRHVNTRDDHFRLRLGSVNGERFRQERVVVVMENNSFSLAGFQQTVPDGVAEIVILWKVEIFDIWGVADSFASHSVKTDQNLKAVRQ